MILVCLLMLLIILKITLKKSIQISQTITTSVADASDLLLQLVLKESRKGTCKKLFTKSNADLQYTIAFFQTSRHEPKNCNITCNIAKKKIKITSVY